LSFDLSPEQFRQLMIAALEDSPRARAIVRQAFLPSFPVRGGNPTTNYIVKFVSGGTGDSLMYETTGGNIGVATTTPAYPLDVNNNAIGVGKATSGFGGSLRIRDDSGTARWLVGLLGSSGATKFVVSDTINHHQPFEIETGAPQDMLYLTSDGSVVLGGTASKQSSGGPEKLSFQQTGTDAEKKVSVANFVGSEAYARLLIDMQGNHEWAGPDDTDQNVLLGWLGSGWLALQGVAGGGLKIKQYADTQPRIQMNNNDTPGVQFGDGEHNLDASIYRPGSNQLNVQANKVGVNLSSPNFVLHTAASAVALGAPATEPANADLNRSNLTFWVDDSGQTKVLYIKVKLNDDSVKTVALTLT
jgi:hypothetical protein